MKKYKKLLLNSVIFGIGNFGSKILLLILVPFYTYTLSTSEYGTADLLSTTINLLLPVVSLSIYEATLRFSMEKNENSKLDVLAHSILLSVSTMIVSTVVLILIDVFFPIPYLYYLIVILFFQCFQNILAQYARANNKLIIYSINGIVITVILCLSNILLLSTFSLGVDGYLLSIALSNIFSIFFLFIALKIKVKKIIEVRLSIELLKAMITYSIPLIPNALMWWLMNASSRFFILYILGASANGIFAVSAKIPSILSMVQTVFFQAWQLTAIEENEDDGKEKFYSVIFYWLSTVMMISTSLILLILKPILIDLVSVSYSESWKAVPFLLVGLIFSSYSSFFGTFYIAEKKTSGVMKTSLVGGVSSLVLNWFMISWYGLIGAGISTMISFLVIWVYRLIDTRTFIRVDIKIRRIFVGTALILLQTYLLFVYDYFSVNFIILFILCTYLIYPTFKKLLKRGKNNEEY